MHNRQHAIEVSRKCRNGRVGGSKYSGQEAEQVRRRWRIDDERPRRMTGHRREHPRIGGHAVERFQEAVYSYGHYPPLLSRGGTAGAGESNPL